jgi:hypothetical protein
VSLVASLDGICNLQHTGYMKGLLKLCGVRTSAICPVVWTPLKSLAVYMIPPWSAIYSIVCFSPGERIPICTKHSGMTRPSFTASYTHVPCPLGSEKWSSQVSQWASK